MEMPSECAVPGIPDILCPDLVVCWKNINPQSFDNYIQHHVEYRHNVRLSLADPVSLTFKTEATFLQQLFLLY